MAKKRAIEFEFDGQPLTFEMNKVDRTKLYGFKELEVLDESGERCELTTLAGDGKTLIGKGGTGLAHLTVDGDWVEKSALKPVDLDSNPITPVKSSFSAPIVLDGEISIDEYLNHNVRLIYQLDWQTENEAFLEKLKSGSIFKFAYSFRGGLEADSGFLLMNDDEEVFFLVGDETSVTFKGLQQAAPVAGEQKDQDDADDAGGLMDFGMI